MHVGHRKLLSRAKEFSLPVGVTSIVGGKGKSLFTEKERERVFSGLGIDFVFSLSFEKIRELSPEAFIGLLEEEFSPSVFVCGEDFRFGFQAAGTPETLKREGQVRVEVVELLEINGGKVSASRIKTHLSAGEVEEANVLLGETFFLEGEVFPDRRIGRTIGFPTANIAYPKEKFPLKKGVYQTEITVNGVSYQGITNYGARPTFDDETVCTETYIDGFSGDLYGKRLKINFLRFLREIKKFDGVDGLKEQLQADIRRIRNYD